MNGLVVREVIFRLAICSVEAIGLSISRPGAPLIGPVASEAGTGICQCRAVPPLGRSILQMISIWKMHKKVSFLANTNRGPGLRRVLNETLLLAVTVEGRTTVTGGELCFCWAGRVHNKTPSRNVWTGSPPGQGAGTAAGQSLIQRRSSRLGVLMTKWTLWFGRSFSHCPSSGVHHLHIPRDPWPIFAMEAIQRPGRHNTHTLHQLLQHQNLAHLAMEPPVGARPANTRVSAAVRPGG